MLSRPRRSLEIGLRIIVAGACCLAIRDSWKFAIADYLFQKDAEDSLRAAIGLVPDGWQYYMRLSQLDRAHTHDLLDTSLRLNRYNAQANIELGLQYEADGDFSNAEKQLLEAYSVDHTYLPRWSLANYYFRRNNLQAFWIWARKAAEMPADDIGPLFELCWHVSPDPEAIEVALLSEKPEPIRQYLNFLLAKEQLQAVGSVAARLVRSGDAATDRPLIFAVINRLIAGKNPAPADTLWKSLIEKQWVVADGTVPNNANFVREPLPVSFDWSLPEYPGLHSWPGGSGLEVEFAGSEPEDCTVAEQVVILTPGDYSLAYNYSTKDIPPATGIRWQIIDAKSNAMLGNSPDLSSDGLSHSFLFFTVPPGASTMRLRLGYRRALGTPRISGMLVITSTKIQAR